MKIERKIDNEYRNKSLSNAKRSTEFHYLYMKSNWKNRETVPQKRNVCLCIFSADFRYSNRWHCVGIRINFIVYEPEKHKHNQRKKKKKMK